MGMQMHAVGNQKTASSIAKSSVQDIKQHNKPMEPLFHGHTTSNKETFVETFARPSESLDKKLEECVGSDLLSLLSMGLERTLISDAVLLILISEEK
ncbi:hypothetical protein KSP40_PGU004371 [Platanthera guangdongensis]|uniref:Uncharacterized protein n=1 Tax=Platanthera guangdongensis TaxID=2320717 RepID=A0ABR2N4M9_9ASPA